jgi:Fe-S cluster biogenesis protein NfuA
MTQQEIITKLEEQIQKIQPIMTSHGGGVEILEASEEEVILGLKGHCAGCPLAPVTFGLVLKKHITEALPELKKVSYVNVDQLNKALAEEGVVSHV